MKRIFLILFFFSFVLFAQSDWVKWNAKEVSYEIQQRTHHDYTIEKSSFGIKLLSYLRNAYYFFISDIDGDNCPFYPSCSSFFIQSVNETNIIKGSLMFSDRFIRDLNLFKSINHYQLHKSGKYFDPAYNYTLDPKKIKLYTGDIIVK